MGSLPVGSTSDAHPLSLTLYLAMAMGVIAFIAFLLLPSSRRVGVELYTWSAIYPAYLLAVVQLGTSLARYAILAFPVAPMLVGLVPRPPRRARAWLMILIGAGAVLQAAWLWEIWRYVGGDLLRRHHKWPFDP